MHDKPVIPGSELVLGGARSGKSRHAQTNAVASGLSRLLIATAEAGDDEMAARIAHHKHERGNGWRVLEVPLTLVEALRREAAPDRIIVVDCITLWLSNLVCAGSDGEAEVARLVEGLAGLEGPVTFVSNEVGFGIVPESELGRRFRDLQGRANQQLAAAVDRVTLVVAGIPLRIKGAA